MDNNTPSQNPVWKKAEALAHSVASLVGGVRTFFARVMVLPLVALLALVLLFVAWSCERQARLEDAEAVAQSKQQAAMEISRLQAEVKTTVAEANQKHAQAVQQFESQQQSLEREAARLRESLRSLRQQELARVDEVATLPIEQVEMRVAARLGPSSLATLERNDSGSEIRGPGANKSALPPTTDSERSAKLSPATGSVATERATGLQSPNPSPASPTPSLSLTGQGLRKVETAFVQLDACREQSRTLEQQVDNCHQQTTASAGLIDEQNLAITKLNTALADKDKILAQTDAQHRAELKAARGSLKSRFFGAVKYVAAGVLIGVLAR